MLAVAVAAVVVVAAAAAAAAMRLISHHAEPKSFPLGKPPPAPETCLTARRTMQPRKRS